MKNKKLFIKILFLLTASLIVLYPGCGEDTINNNGGTGSGGWHPNFNFVVNQRFVYTNDSLHPIPPGGTTRTRKGTTLTINDTAFIAGQYCYPFIGNTYDTATNQNIVEQYYFRYDQAAGKYYQLGIRQLIDTTQPETWDLVGDFDLPRNTSYFIGTISYTIPLPPPFNNVVFSGPLNGKVLDSVLIQSTGNPPQQIPCYPIELKANISGTVSGQTITAEIILMYYLGYSTPTGIVELKLSPFSFYLLGNAILNEPGFDRKIFSHTP